MARGRVRVVGAGVFISYRRNDSDVAAGRLADDLSDIFGRNAVFRDVDTLEAGEDYTDALRRSLNSSAALIAVIGPSWSTITDDGGQRRLDDPDDWVRTEIGEALRRGIRVIPVLISAAMPREADVPPDLQPLLKRQALQVTDRHWRHDVELLAQALEKLPGLARRSSASAGFRLRFSRRTLLVAAAPLLLGVGGWLGWDAWRDDPSGRDLSSRVRIRDSGPDGTVAGLAVSSAMEASLAEQGRPVTLSARYLYERARRTDRFADSSSLGTSLTAALYVAGEWGAPPEESWPYVAGSAALPKGVTWAEMDAAAADFRADSYRLSRYEDIPGQLALGRAVVAEVDVTGEWSREAATTGVITYGPKSEVQGLHAIVIVAFDPGDHSIKFANSWGVKWGSNGFGTMSADVARHVLGDMWAVEVPVTRRS